MSDDSETLLRWIPSHTWISEMALEKTFKIPYTDLKIKINKYILQQRQHRWSNNNYNVSRNQAYTMRMEAKLQKKPKITHSYSLKEKEQPMCHACQTAYIINIFSVNALIWPLQEKDFIKQAVWKNYKKTKVDAIMSFLKAVGLYGKI